MIRRTRSSGSVRTALCAAALLSLMAAFGLHPEPAGSYARAAELGIAAKAALGAPAHDCIACLKGGTAMVTAPGGLAPVAAASACATPRCPADAPARLVSTSLSGRAPPAAVSA